MSENRRNDRRQGRTRFDMRPTSDSEMNRYAASTSSVGRSLFSLLAFPLLWASPVLAQEDAPPPPTWSLESEIGASVFFGATDQTTVAVGIGLDQKSSRFQLENDLSYLYGEASDEVGETFVNKRSWSLGSNLDYRGFSWVNPYVFAGALSSLEKAIEIRYKGGAGAKLTVLDSEASRLSFALAALAERTVERSSENGDSEILARWAGEFHLHRGFSGGRTALEAKANYSPVFDQSDNYTVTAESSIAFKLSEIISLRLSVVDNYDSRAKDRGARDNNDGRVLFSVLSSF
jgi:hypothetical protein